MSRPLASRTTNLRQNVPNPFNPTTSIAYEVPASGCHVTIDILDVSGREVRRLVNEYQEKGRREIVWDGCDNDGRAVSRRARGAKNLRTCRVARERCTFGRCGSTRHAGVIR